MRLRCLAERFIAALEPREVWDLKLWSSQVPMFGMATQCSGSDAPVIAWTALRDAMKAECGFDIPFRHQYSCEMCPRKRRHFNPHFMFE